MLHAVIMAGGSGTRFWPASREPMPKQLLKLAGQRSMLQDTVDRLGSLVSPERLMIVTNRRLVGPIAGQLPKIPSGSILGEPCKRDTAPCIGLAAALIERIDRDATMVVMPADHVIQPADEFQRAVTYAANLVEEDSRRIVTFGVRPSYPASTFGYIERGGRLRSTVVDVAPTFEVARFHEKPTADVAQQYIDTGDFYWNSGIFVWKAATVAAALATHEPEMHRRICAIADAVGSDAFEQTLEREFTAIRGKSIDYAVLERHPNVVVVEAPFAWDDVGSWQSLARRHGQDEDGNTVLGKHLGLNTRGSIVLGHEGHLIVTVELKDCIVVHTPDATLVANKHDEEALRDIVRLLHEKGWDAYL